jgi:phage/plasmid-associated DNA primase
MSNEIKYEIFDIPTYKTTIKDAKKIIGTLSEISNILEETNNLHERIDKTDLLRLFVDVDKLKLHNPTATLPQILTNICEYVGCELTEISYTTNFGIETGSHHVVIPNRYMLSSDMKLFWKDFKHMYNYNNEIDIGILDKSTWFRLPNQLKENQLGTEHVIQQGCLSDFVLKCVEGSIKYEPTKRIINKRKLDNFIIPLPETSPSSNCEISDEPIQYKPIDMTDKYLDLLFNVITNKKPNIGYNEILSIATVLKCNHYDKSVFLKFAEPNDDTNIAIRTWNAIKVEDNEYSMGVFIKLAEQCNIIGYNQWRLKYRTYFISIEHLSDPFLASKQILETLNDHLVLCNETWYMLDENNLWKPQKEPSYYVVEELRKYIDYSNLQTATKITQTKDDETRKQLVAIQAKYGKMYSTISTNAYLSVIIKYLKKLLVNNEFLNMLDTTAGVLVFKNGVVDLQTKIFRKGILSSDFVSKTIPYDYIPANPAKMCYVKSILLKILNNTTEHLEYFLSIIGFTFIGLPNLEKSLYFCIDKTDACRGDNGKTFFFDILDTLLPNYVYKTKSSFLEKKNTKVHKQMINMKGMRLVWTDEFGRNEANCELIKEIGDGLKTENEVMYGTSETIKILFKLFVLTNHLPVINVDEGAVFNRFKQISYGSHFDRTGKRTVENPKRLEFIADTSLGDKIKSQYYNEVFQLIIDYAFKYYTNKSLPKVPTQFLNDTKETQQSNDLFAIWFNDYCVFDETSRVSLKQLVYKSNFEEKFIREGMLRLGYKYNKDLSKLGKDISGKSFKGGFQNVKLIQFENEIDEQFDEEIVIE